MKQHETATYPSVSSYQSPPSTNGSRSCDPPTTPQPRSGGAGTGPADPASTPRTCRRHADSPKPRQAQAAKPSPPTHGQRRPAYTPPPVTHRPARPGSDPPSTPAHTRPRSPRPPPTPIRSIPATIRTLTPRSQATLDLLPQTLPSCRPPPLGHTTGTGRHNLTGQHLRQAVIAARCLAVEARRHELLTPRRTRCKAGRLQPPTSLLSQLGEEHELTARIPLTETVRHIQLPPNLRQLHNEPLAIQPPQPVQPCNPPVLLLDRPTQLRTRREVPVGHQRSLRIPHREIHNIRTHLDHERRRPHPLLPRPLIHILKNVTVDSLHVRVVETPHNRVLSRIWVAASSRHRSTAGSFSPYGLPGAVNLFRNTDVPGMK